MVDSASPEIDPEPAALALTAVDDDWSLYLSFMPSRGRSQVRMWPVSLLY